MIISNDLKILVDENMTIFQLELDINSRRNESRLFLRLI